MLNTKAFANFLERQPGRPRLQLDGAVQLSNPAILCGTRRGLYADALYLKVGTASNTA